MKLQENIKPTNANQQNAEAQTLLTSGEAGPANGESSCGARETCGEEDHVEKRSHFFPGFSRTPPKQRAARNRNWGRQTHTFGYWRSYIAVLVRAEFGNLRT